MHLIILNYALNIFIQSPIYIQKKRNFKKSTKMLKVVILG